MRLCILYLLLFFSIGVFAVEKFSIPGDRNVNGSVTFNQNQMDVTLTVSFLGIGCFDALTNDELNLSLSEYYANEIMSVQQKKTVEVNFTHAKLSFSKNDKLLNVSYTFPVKSVQELPDNRVKKSREIIIVTEADNIYSRQELLDSFRSSCASDLKSAGKLLAQRLQQLKDKSDMQGIIKCRKEIDEKLSSLSRKVDDDDTLFISEKQKLNEQIKQMKEKLLTHANTIIEEMK